MSWQYISRSGELLCNGSFYAQCYAGRAAGLDNPDMQFVPDTGPLCVGVYRIGDPVEGSHLGPMAFPLKPDVANVMKGRKDFFIHADLLDALTRPHQASHGCIIASLQVRRFIAQQVAAGDRMLTVVAERTDAQWVGLPPQRTS